jgi:iron uptake system component EfeO
LKKSLILGLSTLCFLSVGCSGSDDKSDADYRESAVSGMHSTLLADIKALHAASQELMDAAPLPTDRGWDAKEDAAAITAMTEAWLRARTAYERTEGAIAPLFPETDAAIDARYDDFLSDPSIGEDTDLFDDQGVTGMHAIERILFANTTRETVVEAEATLPGYVPATWPETAAEAAEFKNKLCARLEADTAELVRQWAPPQIDLDGAFSGLVALMNEQREKIVKASTFEQESRYSDRTMADIRDNLAGTRAAYASFEAWVETKSDGAAINAKIQAGFDALDAAYATVSGDAIPEPPASWSSETPSSEDLATPFGKLYSAVFSAINPNEPDSVVSGMNEAAEAIGLTITPE